jgi:hypothetical protein
MPPTNDAATIPTTTTTMQPTITKTATLHQPQLPTIDEQTPIDNTDATIATQHLKPTVNISKALEQLELWHQRMGHPAQ